MSIVRTNLMCREGYTPYCGRVFCFKGMPRTVFNGSQFECSCGWETDFEKDFIDDYKKKWGLDVEKRIDNE